MGAQSNRKPRGSNANNCQQTAVPRGLSCLHRPIGNYTREHSCLQTTNAHSLAGPWSFFSSRQIDMHESKVKRKQIAKKLSDSNCPRSQAPSAAVPESDSVAGQRTRKSPKTIRHDGNANWTCGKYRKRTDTHTPDQTSRAPVGAGTVPRRQRDKSQSKCKLAMSSGSKAIGSNWNECTGWTRIVVRRKGTIESKTILHLLHRQTCPCTQLPK